MSESSAAEETSIPFTAHWQELRKRSLISLLSLLLASVGALIYSRYIWLLVFMPLKNIGDVHIINIDPAEAVSLDFKLALLAGLVLSSPVWVWQLWRFISPAIAAPQRRNVAKLLLVAPVLGVLGVVFSMQVFLPGAFHFLSNYGLEQIDRQWTQQSYSTFVLRSIVVFFLAFQMPVFSWVLSRAGLLSATFLQHHFRTGVLLIAVFSALLTPPDPFSMVLMAIPLTLLLAFSWLICRGATRRDSNG